MAATKKVKNPRKQTTPKKPHKKSPTYNKGVNDAIESMSLSIRDCFVSDPYADRYQIETILRIAQDEAKKNLK
jgi:hypothetical protein